MKLNMEMSAFLAGLAEMASEAKDEARIKFPGTQADAVTMGVAHFYEHIRVTFEDAAEFNISPETESEVLQKAISRYCRKWCDHSKDQEPGTHDSCPSCPLMPFTIGAVEEVVGRVMGDE